MAIIEKLADLKRKDKSGNIYIFRPKTKIAGVDGLQDVIDELYERLTSPRFDTPFASTSTDGVNYTVTVPGMDSLTVGYSFVMVPDRISADVNTWLNVNSLGNKRLRIKGGGHTGLTVAPTAANWLAPNKPVRVTYDGLWWVADLYQ